MEKQKGSSNKYFPFPQILHIQMWISVYTDYYKPGWDAEQKYRWIALFGDG